MDFKLIVAIVVGKIISRFTRLTGGGATAAPGLYALKIDRNLVKKLSKKIEHGSIIVSGTNGKTTTARLIYDILSTRYKVIHNRQGSNLLRGIASTLISKSSIFGQVRANIALWEIDEATVPVAIENLSPKMIILLNLFRDQLDRYGEVDTIRQKWADTISKKSKNAVLILNADDPGISFLARSHKGQIIYFGVEDKKINLPSVSQVADIKHCLNCGASLNFSSILSAHLGHYNCPNCPIKRPKPDVSAQKLQFKKDLSVSSQFSIFNSQLSISYSLPGLYNVYNVLAATSIAHLLKFDHTLIAEKIKDFSSAFGRFQKVKVLEKNVIMFLIKNPTGANEVLRTISNTPNLNILAILNDNFADGKDVSWIWDTHWEILAGRTKRVGVSGIRKWDLANRLKYAQINLSKNSIYKDISYSIKATIKDLNNKDTLYILPTYTALLAVHKTLSKLDKGISKWHEQ